MARDGRVLVRIFYMADDGGCECVRKRRAEVVGRRYARDAGRCTGVYRLAYINCIKPVPFRNVGNLPLNNNGCLEEKSIAELISGQNPYEVVRKPPKKRKKVEENCFVNEALNLAQPEPQLNPYEVKRPPKDLAEPFERESHSYVNLALNLKAPEHKVLNPFEIPRPEVAPVAPVVQEVVEEQPLPRPLIGIENPALDVKIPIAIAVPFTPTINHRIDFSQLKTPEPPAKDKDDTQLTPSEMLSKKLVFSPKEQNCATPKRLFGKSLSTISEEAVDIDQELDCYQLQLENSINEAKLNNRKYFTDIRKDVLKKTVTVTHQEVTTIVQERAEVAPPSAQVMEVIEPKARTATAGCSSDFEEDDDDDDSFDLDNIDHGNYQPFKRAYVRPAASLPTNNNDDAQMPPPPKPMTEQKTKTESHDGLKGIIRRSIRKITKPKTKKTVSKEDVNQDGEGKPSEMHVIMSSIRRSLRKRKLKPEDYPSADLHDVSVIIDESRTVFKERTEPKEKIMRAPTAPVAGASAPTIAPATTMLRNSIRRGKNNLMKNILQKKVEDYDFK